ncbi:hypothetical protein D3C78_982210 [compost metagenome]
MGKLRVGRRVQIQTERIVGQNTDVTAGRQRQGARQLTWHRAFHHHRQLNPIVITLGGDAGNVKTLRRWPVPGCRRWITLPGDGRRNSAFPRRTPVGFPAFLQLYAQQQTGFPAVRGIGAQPHLGVIVSRAL